MNDYSKITALYSRLSVGDEDRDGGEMATAKIRTVKGLRVEIFSRFVRKNTTLP